MLNLEARRETIDFATKTAQFEHANNLITINNQPDSDFLCKDTKKNAKKRIFPHISAYMNAK